MNWQKDIRLKQKIQNFKLKKYLNEWRNVTLLKYNNKELNFVKDLQLKDASFVLYFLMFILMVFCIAL